jgi:hypothetical protein
MMSLEEIGLKKQNKTKQNTYPPMSLILSPSPSPLSTSCAIVIAGSTMTTLATEASSPCHQSAAPPLPHPPPSAGLPSMLPKKGLAMVHPNNYEPSI